MICGDNSVVLTSVSFNICQVLRTVMANLYLILAISFEEIYIRRFSSGVALAMTFNRHNSEKRTLSLDLDEADCLLHGSGRSTIKLFILLVLLPIVVVSTITMIQSVSHEKKQGETGDTYWIWET